MMNTFLTIDDQPIVALSTPQGSGALALIRISGKSTVELVDAMAKLSSKKARPTCSRGASPKKDQWRRGKTKARMKRNPESFNISCNAFLAVT